METYLVHHGILGQKWGVRRYQNADGTLTNAGKSRYGSQGTGDISTKKGIQNRLNDLDQAIAYNKRANKDLQKENVRKTASTKGYREGSRKVARAASKINKNNAEIEKNRKYIEEGQKEIDRLISKANEMGLSVSSRDTMRYALKGKDYLNSAAKAGVLSGITAAAATFAGAPAAVTTAAGVGGSLSITRDMLDKAHMGKVYKVKNAKEGKKQGNESARVANQERQNRENKIDDYFYKTKEGKTANKHIEKIGGLDKDYINEQKEKLAARDPEFKKLYKG